MRTHHWFTAVAVAVSILLSVVVVPISSSGADVLETSELAPTEARRAALQVDDDVGAIYRLYMAYFDREPDAGGLWFWVDEHRSGAALASIADRFARSPEFDSKYGPLDDAAFVELVYESVLDRTGDVQGLAHWRSELLSGTARGELMIAFSESLEFRIATGFVNVGEVERLYAAAFLRSPDDEGLQFWLAQRSRGTDLAHIATQFTTSDEFIDTYGALSDADFVARVYRNVLERNPDAGGLAFWVERMETITRGELLIGFSNSREFQDRTGIADTSPPQIPKRPTPTVPASPAPPVAPIPVIVEPTPPIVLEPSPVGKCNYEAGEARFHHQISGDAPYLLRLEYSMSALDLSCRTFLENGSLTVRGPGVSEWEVVSHQIGFGFGPKEGLISVLVPESAFDDDIGIAVDATYTFDFAGLGPSRLDWNNQAYLPLAHEITADPEPIPFDQANTTIEISVARNSDAPNRPLTLQVKQSPERRGCAVAGSRDPDEWTDITVREAPFSIEIEVEILDEALPCQLGVRVQSGRQAETLTVLRHAPPIEGFEIGGTSTCPDADCETTIAFFYTYVRTGVTYEAVLEPLAAPGGNHSVRLRPTGSSSGLQTFSIHHDYLEGFCVAINTQTSAFSFVGHQTPYQCYAPSAQGWTQVPAPAGRFEDEIND